MEQGWTDMGPADTNRDIFSQPIFLLIPITIYLHQHIGHRYRYFHFGRYLADNWYVGRYMLIFWPMSMYFSQYFVDTNITDIQSSRYRYRYGRYTFCRYRYIGININISQIYRLTDIWVQPQWQEMIQHLSQIYTYQIFCDKVMKTKRPRSQ